MLSVIPRHKLQRTPAIPTPKTALFDVEERVSSVVATVEIRTNQANQRMSAKPEAAEVTPSVFEY